MTVYFIWDNMTTFSPFVECLKSLSNLHTLSIGYMDDSDTTSLTKALEGVTLPQIKTLHPTPCAYSLFQHCPNVEDIVCSTAYRSGRSNDGFLRSLMSNPDSKLKRLAIPLALLPNSSRMWSDTPWDRGMLMTTDHLRPQNLWLRVQGSPNSPWSSATITMPNRQKQEP